MFVGGKTCFLNIIIVVSCETFCMLINIDSVCIKLKIWVTEVFELCVEQLKLIRIIETSSFEAVLCF